jgi:hypothetical protein
LCLTDVSLAGLSSRIRMAIKNGRQVAHYKHRLLLMLDEFPSLGKIEIQPAAGELQAALTLLAAKRWRRP